MACRWLTSFIFVIIVCAAARGEWEVTEIDGRDYVTLASVADFYGMGTPVRRGGKEYQVSGGGRSLLVKIDRREAIVDGVRHWLSFPVRLKGESLYVSRTDVAKTIDPAYRPAAVAGLRPVTTVVLDPGHGGHDKGARSRYGLEKEYTLDMVARIRKRLEKAGVKVVQTRLSDFFVPLESRPAMTRKYDNPIFVSIHFNSADWNLAANGFEIFAIPPIGAPPTGQGKPAVRDRQRESGHAFEPVNMVLANTIYHSLLGKTSMFDRGVKRARFAVLRHATAPAVLIEGGFLTNAGDAGRIESAAWRDQYADAIVAGILEFKKLAEKKETPRRVADYGRAPTTEFVPED